ncbi:MAG: hypothetical protein IT380_16890 [Myxococcales bacterium]|nr:hypothetical protein [Myxococcales bacterium]
MSRYFTWLGLWLLCASSCQPRLRSAGVPTVGDTLATAAAADSFRIVKECQALRDKPVTWREEEAFGATLALDLAHRAGSHPIADGGVAWDPAWLGLTAEETERVDRELNLLGKGLAAFSGRGHLPWVFGALDVERPLFFGSPGGFVFVTTGLLSRVENDAQLAMVLMLAITRVAERRDVAFLSRALEVECLAAAMTEKSNDQLLRAFGEPLTELPAGLSRKVSDKFLTLTLASTVTTYEPELVDRAVETLAFAGYQPLDGARLLETLKGGEAPWRYEGVQLAEEVRRATEALPARSFHLTTPRSKAAALVFQKRPTR